MVRRVTSKPRRGGYHMQSGSREKTVKIDGVDRTIFYPNPPDQELDSRVEVDRYLQSHIFDGRLHQQDYRD